VDAAALGPDAALTDHLTSSLADILSALEQFLRFEGADPATRHSAWLPKLDQPLPDKAIGPSGRSCACGMRSSPRGCGSGTRGS
jgi:hypothetical protein